MNRARRNGAIDFLRLLFCMGVVFCHGRNLGGTPEIALFADAGYIGVEFFFLVSGFLMAKSAARKQDAACTHLGTETVLFLWHKIKPVLPYYLFAVIFSYSRTVIAKEFTPVEAVRNLMLGVWDLFFLRMSGIKTYGIVRATWYLSAMYIAMFILYPMIRKWQETFTHIIAPLIAIFFLGYLSQKYGNLNQYTGNYTLVYSGVLRALAEISLGCVCYVVCEKIQLMQFTKFSRLLITLVQVFGYAGVLYCQNNLPGKYFDFVLVVCLAACIPLSFSGQGIATSLFQHKIFPWLGKLSVVIYLNHMWVKDTVEIVFPSSWGYWRLTAIYIAGVFAASMICMLWAKVLNLFWEKHGTRIRGWFLKE